MSYKNNENTNENCRWQPYNPNPHKSRVGCTETTE